MLIVTINEVPGKKIEALGVVRGSTVQSRNLGHDMMALRRTQMALQEADEQLHLFHAGELVAESLRQAQLSLNEITGEFTADDLLGKIFGSFCIGK